MSHSSGCWRCPLCNFFATHSVKGVIRHIGSVHSHEANFSITCGLQSCPRSYVNFHSYKRHVYKKHRDILELDDVAVPEPDATLPELEAWDLNDSDIFGYDEVHNVPPLYQEKRQSALFLLKTTTVSKVSETALDNLIGDVSILLETKIEKLRKNLKDVLHQKGMQFDDKFASLFQDDRLTAPFQGLHTEYLRKAFYREEMACVEPVERVLSEVTGNSKKLDECVYEVPLLLSLKQLLSDPFILDEVLRGHQRHDGLIADFCDGEVYQSHPLFSQDHRALQIMAYYDDVEVCNPLGSRAKTHKLALFYYTLGNISPVYRSTMKCIQLLAVTKSSVLQEYGADRILESVMEDIKLLEQDAGVSFEIHGTNYTFNGTLSLIPGDNLASQYLGGFKAFSSALRKCRQCMAVDDDMQSQFVSEAFQSRCRETHAAHCSSLQGPLRDHFATTYGVNKDSILNTSRYFHVTEGLIPDVMHDLLEGVLPLEAKELIRFYINTKKCLTLVELNKRIKSFPYSGLDACNKPAPILSPTLYSHDHALKQTGDFVNLNSKNNMQLCDIDDNYTATQMWCLARLLPLMIGDKIEADDRHWDNYLLLLSIADYCLAPVISKDWAAYVRTIINDHHYQFKQLYPTCRLTPKMHYLIHYPEMMCKYGPLVRYWCMRFEGKHAYFKDLAHRVKCFKNIPKTMAYRHQRSTCYYINGSRGSPFYKESKTSPVTDSSVNTLQYKAILLTEFPNFTENSEIKRLSWVEVRGTTYKKKSVVVLGMQLVPTFGIIEDIIVLDTDIYHLICEVLLTEYFDHHLHAFKARKQSSVEYSICKQKDLHDHTVLAAYECPGHPGLFNIPLKYQLVDD